MTEITNPDTHRDQYHEYKPRTRTSELVTMNPDTLTMTGMRSCGHHDGKYVRNYDRANDRTFVQNHDRTHVRMTELTCETMTHMRNHNRTYVQNHDTRAKP